MMKHIPYALNDARQLCNKLQHIVGMTFDPELPEMGPIECVAVSPFDQNNKKRFLLFYLLTEDAEKALEAEYLGLLYDVIVIARSSEIMTDLMQYDLETWASKNSLSLEDISTCNPLEKTGSN